ncbi:uncharacterized, partial [Tachysurus ichikawai]
TQLCLIQRHVTFSFYGPSPCAFHFQVAEGNTASSKVRNAPALHRDVNYRAVMTDPSVSVRK